MTDSGTMRGVAGCSPVAKEGSSPMTEHGKMRAALLFARPSALGGVASILDFGDTLTEYNTANSPEQADTLALWSDWLAVGDDLRWAFGAFEDEHSDELAQSVEVSSD